MEKRFDVTYSGKLFLKPENEKKTPASRRALINKLRSVARKCVGEDIAWFQPVYKTGESGDYLELDNVIEYGQAITHFWIDVEDTLETIIDAFKDGSFITFDGDGSRGKYTVENEALSFSLDAAAC